MNKPLASTLIKNFYLLSSSRIIKQLLIYLNGLKSTTFINQINKKINDTGFSICWATLFTLY